MLASFMVVRCLEQNIRSCVVALKLGHTAELGHYSESLLLPRSSFARTFATTLSKIWGCELSEPVLSKLLGVTFLRLID